MKAVKEFILKRGLALKLGGFGVAVVAGLVSIFFDQPRYRNMFVLDERFTLPNIALAVAFVGVAVHVVGRWSYARQRKEARLRKAEKKDDWEWD